MGQCQRPLTPGAGRSHAARVASPRRRHRGSGEVLRPVRAADQHVHLARPALALVGERRAALPAEGPGHAGRGVEARRLARDVREACGGKSAYVVNGAPVARRQLSQ